MTNTSGGSRFGISPNEWEGMVKSELGMLLSLDSRQEKLIEINIIPQLYKRTLRANEGRTTTLVWSEESIEDKRRIATDGLMQLSIHGAEERFIDVGIRPMFIL